uniref:DNA-directed RNA polymerases I and III subunit RPAC2 n=1 Tax=Oncorhynchus tshawytscha TaxID=74940 RepID=A0AAZ3NU53_ONCTS
MGKRTHTLDRGTLPRRPASWSRLFTVDVDTGVLRVQADGTDEGCVTFVLHEEDHTLGNSLRYMVMKSLDVDFCGYSITHPSESKINFRIQTRGGVPAVEPLRRGLNELSDVCQHVLNTFQRSVSEFRSQQDDVMD